MVRIVLRLRVDSLGSSRRSLTLEFIDACVARQTVEHLQATEPDPTQKHRFDGSFINRERDWPILEHYTLVRPPRRDDLSCGSRLDLFLSLCTHQHRSLWILCEMWCGLIFPSSDSRSYLLNLVEEGTKIEHSIHGFAFFPVRPFLSLSSLLSVY